MIRCAHCGQLIPDEAPWCVKCGAPKPERHVAATAITYHEAAVAPRDSTWNPLRDLDFGPSYDARRWLRQITEQHFEGRPHGSGCAVIAIPRHGFLSRFVMTTDPVTSGRLILRYNSALVVLDVTAVMPASFAPTLDMELVAGAELDFWPEIDVRDIIIAWEWLVPLMVQ